MRYRTFGNVCGRRFIVFDIEHLEMYAAVGLQFAISKTWKCMLSKVYSLRYRTLGNVCGRRFIVFDIECLEMYAVVGL